MKTFFRLLKAFALMIILPAMLPRTVAAQAFVHPGINQTAADLNYMKGKILSGEQPYKDAFERLKATDTAFTYKPYAHVLRGPYGKPNIGGDDLSRSANMAYNYALLWYITKNKTYADKAIEIINAWSAVLWDFDYNDAKLLAAWTGHLFCNAAEILRYTNAGWQQKDIEKFSKMLLTVYYPLMRYYFPQANGNWDGAITHSLMAIAIFTDNRSLFNNAVDHFLHGPVNGSIFKYIYPSGQCQESRRDQGHVQLGLGEFAGAAQVAFTQGVDLFSIGNNRIALGYEYTASFLLGKTPQCYGTISERAKVLRDDYEYVYRHYTSMGIQLRYTKIAADSVRSKASRSILTSVRAPVVKGRKPMIDVKPETTGYVAGAGRAQTQTPADAVLVEPGQSVQKALDAAAGTGRWIVLAEGIHTLAATLKIPSGVTLAGKGLNTILFLDPASGQRDALVNAADDLHDVTIRNLVIEGATKTDPGTDPNSGRSFHGGTNRGGIIFKTGREGQIKNITLINVTVQNCTFKGVAISGGENIQVNGCDLNENGSNVIPGARLLHNLLLDHCSKIAITDSRLTTSPFGSGIALTNCINALVTNCEISRNGYYGLLMEECKNVTVTRNLVEGNDRSGVIAEFLHDGCKNVSITANIIRYNNGFGVELLGAENSQATNNKYAGNGNSYKQQKVSAAKTMVLE